MPNWVKTKLHIFNVTDEDFQKIVDTYTTENEYQGRKLDFEKIIPMPENIYRGNIGPDEQAKYGENNWYDWCIKNWGTKWNSCYNYIDFADHSFEFETAWTFAEPVVTQLSQQTGHSIIAKYADEDFGCNCGVVMCEKDGSIYSEDIGENTDEAWDLVEELWGITREELEEEQE